MKIQKIERGIHTIELYACNLKYEQVQKVMDWLAEEKQLQIVRRDPFNIDRHAKSDFLIASGVRIRIDQSHCMSCVWRTMPIPENWSFSLKNSASARWT